MIFRHTTYLVRSTRIVRVLGFLGPISFDMITDGVVVLVLVLGTVSVVMKKPPRRGKTVMAN